MKNPKMKKKTTTAGGPGKRLATTPRSMSSIGVSRLMLFSKGKPRWAKTTQRAQTNRMLSRPTIRVDGDLARGSPTGTPRDVWLLEAEGRVGINGSQLLM